MAYRKHVTFLVSGLLLGILFVTPISALDTITTTNDKEERQAQIEERRQELRTKVTTMREARQEKLDAKRLDVCQKRQERINSIVSKSVEQSTKHLATFQKIEERVTQFYIDKSLTVTNFDELVATVDEKEAAAIASIDISAETTFDCETTDGSNPGSIVRDLVRSQHQALKEYRTAIKDLIVAVKSSQSSADTNDTTETEVE